MNFNTWRKFYKYIFYINHNIIHEERKKIYVYTQKAEKKEKHLQACVCVLFATWLGLKFGSQLP